MNVSMNNTPYSSRRMVVSKEKTEENSHANLLRILPDEIVLMVLEYINFPTLCYISIVCKHWMKMVGIAINNRQGHKAFTTNAELRQRVREYCSRKIVKYADELLRIYGWPINKWNVSEVTDFSLVFTRLVDFNENIGDWDVSNGTIFTGMFSHAISFDQNIGNWNVSQATNFSFMFSMAGSFNQDLSRWNISKATNMRGMFNEASSFNGDVSTWNTQNVIEMARMFYLASSFNQDISSWNTSKVRNMSLMFYWATSFFQNLSSWNVTNVQQEFRLAFHDDASLLIDHPEYLPRFLD